MEQNYLIHNLHRDPIRFLDRYPEGALFYTGHLLFNIANSVTFVFIVQSLFDGPEIVIHLIAGLKLSRS